MSVLVFDYDKKTKKVNQIIKKLFGASCNCFFAYDLEKYEKQLGIYKDYISQISPLKINTYVLGILSNKIKQIS